MLLDNDNAQSVIPPSPFRTMHWDMPGCDTLPKGRSDKTEAVIDAGELGK